MDDKREDLPDEACFVLDVLISQLAALNARVEEIDARLAEIHKTHPISRLLRRFLTRQRSVLAVSLLLG